MYNKCYGCDKINFECKESDIVCETCHNKVKSGHYFSVNDIRIENGLEKEDVINKPNHYHSGIQPIEAIETNFEELETKGFLKGNVIKYVLRSNKKGKELEDLKKAQWNLNKLIERLEDK